MRTHLVPLLLRPLAASAFILLHLNEGNVCNDLPSGKWYCRTEADCAGSRDAMEKGWEPAVCSYGSGEGMILCCPPREEDFFLPPGPVRQLAWSGSWDKPPPNNGWNIPREPKPAASSTPAAGLQSGEPTWNVTSRPTATTEGPAVNQVQGPDATTTPASRPEPVRYPSLAYPPGSAAAKAQDMCKNYSQYVWMVEPIISYPGAEPAMKEYCGRSTKPLVFGGEDAEAFEFPHMARIGYGDEEDIHYQCGGSLISERYILSAAHCAVVDNREASWANLGDCNLNTEKDVPKEEVVTVRIVERIVHPDYNRTKNWYNDIALFRLEKDLKLGIYVRPACLNTRSYRTEKWLIASGWGLTKPYSPFAFGSGSQTAATILQKVELKTIPTDVCNSAYSKLSEKDRALFMEGIRPHGMMCAGGVPGKAICNGDSGGPLQALAPACMYDIVGVTSFGLGCKSDYPGVYTNVVDYLEWIVKIVWG